MTSWIWQIDVKNDETFAVCTDEGEVSLFQIT